MTTAKTPQLFGLLHTMNNRLMGSLERKLRRKGLSAGALMTLQLIADRQRDKKRPPTRADVARHLGSTPASVSVMVKRMMDRKWIDAAHKNEQSQYLVMTEEGHDALKQGTRICNAEHRELDKMISVDIKAGLARAASMINMKFERREGEEQLMRLAKTYRGKDKNSREWNAKSKRILERYRSDTKALEFALSSS